MSIVEHAPNFDLESALRIARDLYGLEAAASRLPSERDQNFLLESASGEKFVLKLANATEERSMLEAQNAAMAHLSTRIDLCPRVVPAKNGEDILPVKSPKGERHFTRLVTYLPGTPLSRVMRRSPALLHDLGAKVGLMDVALQGFDHPALHRDFHWDLANGLKIIRQNGDLITDAQLRDWVKAFAENFEKDLAPLLPRLRTSVIHNDANDYNILVGGGSDLYSRNQSVVGLIDFGDMVYSYTVSDLALTIAYAILDQPDPLSIAAQITRGYHAAFPLFEDEITALFGLVTLRLCTSVAIAAEQQSRQPENDYLGISQAPIRNSLPELMKIPSRLAEAVFREACGLAPVRSSPTITRWLGEHTDEFGPVLETDIRTTPVTVLDLSMGSPLLSSDPAQNEEALLTPRIAEVMKRTGAKCRGRAIRRGALPVHLAGFRHRQPSDRRNPHHPSRN